MADYTAAHLKALEKVRVAGVPVQFSTDNPGTYDPETDSWIGGGTSTVAGHAVEIPGDPEEYEALELIGTAAVTLMFVPTTMGQTPSLNSTVSWAGAVRTVKYIFPIRPAGTLIAARVVVT